MLKGWIGGGIIGLTLLSGRAIADQCTNLSATKSQWDWAKRHAQNAQSVLSFCAPCGDKMPKPGHLDKDADLAYLYVQVGDNNFANLARLVGCPVQGVPDFIDAGGRPH